LEKDGLGPEKSLMGLNQHHLMQSFLVNAIGPALVPASSLLSKL
jgi:hypothetical protein